MKYTQNIVHQVRFICKHYKHAYVESPCILDSCEPKLDTICLHTNVLVLLTFTILPNIEELCMTG